MCVPSGLGEVYIAQGDVKAREALEKGRGIIFKLVTRSPNNADWKNDLARFDELLAALKP